MIEQNHVPSIFPGQGVKHLTLGYAVIQKIAETHVKIGMNLRNEPIFKAVPDFDKITVSHGYGLRIVPRSELRAAAMPAEEIQALREKYGMIESEETTEE